MSDQIVYNALRTPDGTVLVSRNRHDYQTYEDANGKSYCVDGGLDYIRRSAWGDETDLTLYADDDFELVRKKFARGSRGIDGKQPLTYIPLCNMTDDHLLATIEYCREHNASDNEIFDLYIKEANWRDIDV